MGIQYQPELLREYANPPELVSKDEAGMQEFHAQMKLRQQKAKEVPEEVFSLDYLYLEKEENNNYMHVQLESCFDYIGGGASGKIFLNTTKYIGIFINIMECQKVILSITRNVTKIY